jgi:3-hydroxybenzoate 6-monooxygenase
MTSGEGDGMGRAGNDVIVVGGGIGGLATALALAQSGLSVTLLERAPQFSEVGAGLQFGPNAVRALDRLGLAEKVYPLAVFPEQGIIKSAITGETLTRGDFNQGMVAEFGYPYLVLHRNDLLTVLLDACRAHPLVRLLNDCFVEHVVDEGDVVRVVLSGGASHSARLVVGADGLKSSVRKLIVDDEPVFSGYVAFRGTLAIDDVPPSEDRDNVQLWIGPDVHLMQYPVRRGELYNQVAVFKSLRFKEGRTDWGTPDELIERFRSMHPLIQEAIPTLAEARAYPNFDKDPIESFSRGRAVLIGDAAHPMLQYLGQGACMAIEDGIVLAALLSGSVDEPTAALAEYDRKRVPRTTRCQRVARPWGEAWHLTDPVAIAFRDRYFKQRDILDYSDVRWLYRDELITPRRKVLT